MKMKENISFGDHPGLKPDSRIHIFQSVREIKDEEAAEIRKQLDKFIDRWIDKETVNFAAYDILYNRFIVVATEKNLDSGIDCSLDTPLNRVINRLDKKYNFGFMNAMLFSYQTAGEIFTLPLSEFKKRINNGEIPKDSTVFHTGAHTWEEFEKKWELPLEESWVRNLAGMII